MTINILNKYRRTHHFSTFFFASPRIFFSFFFFNGVRQMCVATSKLNDAAHASKIGLKFS